MPKLWEHKVALYCAYLIEVKNRKSSTIKSYVSGIKYILMNDGYPWRDKYLMLSAITRACKLKNDILYMRLPIQTNLLSIILSHLEIKFTNQPYLECLYKTSFLLAYYGLFRVGEITTSEHVLKAKDVHLANNKNKYLLVLYSSKTHGHGDSPQKIPITPTSNQGNKNLKFYCPYQMLKTYLIFRPPRLDDREQFLVFQDNSPMTPGNFREWLKDIIHTIGLNKRHYDTHSFRIGRATNLLKENKSIESIKRMGRWRSNCVYRYLKS